MEFFKRGKGKGGGDQPPDGQIQPASGSRLPSVIEIRKQFLEMDIDQNEVDALSSARERPLFPNELISVTGRINEVLKKGCFNFEVTCLEALGTMIDQAIAKKRDNKDLALPVIAVWRWVDRYLRKAEELDPKVQLSSEQQAELEKRFKALLKESDRRAEEHRLIILGNENRELEAEDGYQPQASKSVEELIRWEAQVQTLRKFKLKPSDSVPDNLMGEYQAELEFQTQEARKKLGIAHDLDDEEKPS